MRGGAERAAPVGLNACMYRPCAIHQQRSLLYRGSQLLKSAVAAEQGSGECSSSSGRLRTSTKHIRQLPAMDSRWW